MLKLALAALTAVLVATPVRADEQIVKASDDSALRGMIDINTFYDLDDDRNHVTVRLFLRSAGDPEMNGNQLLLAIIPAPEQGPRIWNTGVVIDSVRSIAQDTGKSELKVRAVERFRDDQTTIRERQASYVIRYTVDPETGSVADTIGIVKEGAP